MINLIVNPENQSKSFHWFKWRHIYCLCVLYCLSLKNRQTKRVTEQPILMPDSLEFLWIKMDVNYQIYRNQFLFASHILPNTNIIHKYEICLTLCENSNTSMFRLHQIHKIYTFFFKIAVAFNLSITANCLDIIL